MRAEEKIANALQQDIMLHKLYLKSLIVTEQLAFTHLGKKPIRLKSNKCLQ